MALDEPLRFPRTPPTAPRAYLVPKSLAEAPGLAVDTTQREAVRNFYNALFFASEDVPMGWNGALASCTAGTVSTAYREAIRLRINLIRALAGVPATVTFNDAYNAKAQQAALMMSANRALSHAPPPDWSCFTAEGAEAAGKSNLSLGYSGPNAVTFGQLADLGPNNGAVGHRRWLLYPQTQEMGSGDVPGDASHPPANVLWVQDSHLFDPRPATRDGLVAWPPPGYLPYPLAFPRWSLSHPNADFSAATVTVTRDGSNRPVTLEPFAANIGEPTLVWLPDDPLLKDPTPLAQADATFQVSVRNVRVAGQTRQFDYSVTLFDPARESAETVLPSIAGDDRPISGHNNAYTIQGTMPAADGFDWLSGAALPYTTVQDAEHGLGDLEATTTPGYNPVSQDYATAGHGSYHLQDAEASGQSLTLSPWLVPGPSATLSFDSRLGWASPSEAALVQISLDGGNAWRNLYVQKGTDQAGEASFTRRTVSLAAFQDRPVRVRFRFDVPDRSAPFKYYSPGVGVGWYLDNIAFQDVAALQQPAIAAAQGSGFLFVPAAPGTYLLAARGTLHGLPLEWGRVKSVVAQAGGASPPPVADAGLDLSVPAGTTVTLDGRGSHPGVPGSAVPLAFAWTQTAGPPVSLNGAATARPSFLAATPGTYVFSLTVSDGSLNSAADTVTVTVTEPGPLRLIFPAGGETLKVGDRVRVLWQTERLSPNARLRLQFSRNGVRWTSIKVTRNLGHTVWKVAKAQRGETVHLRLCGPARLPKTQRCTETGQPLRIRP
ncbi:PKD domain-containing protein [Candidatus Methylocalor cossyra]